MPSVLHMKQRHCHHLKPKKGGGSLLLFFASVLEQGAKGLSHVVAHLPQPLFGRYAVHVLYQTMEKDDSGTLF